MSLFLSASQSGWYPFFLDGVVKSVSSSGTYQQVLDIGTGPGKLPELLIQNNSSLRIVGIDINKQYIVEAKRRINHTKVHFQHEKENSAFEFKNETFDIITFCSVLFLLDDQTKSFLLNEALRVLKPHGKIIILTPSGKKSSLTALSEIWTFPYSNYNWTYLVWKTLTSRAGRRWRKEKWLEAYSKAKGLNYQSSVTFNENASIEIITKN